MKKIKASSLSCGPRCLFDKRLIWFGIIPGLVLYIGFSVLPSIATFFLSFTDIAIIPGRTISFVGLQNYREVLFQGNSRDALEALKKTIIYSVTTTLFQTIFSLFMAICLCKKFVRGRNFYRAVVFLPTVLGVTVTGLCFRLFFSTDGIAQSVLGLFGESSAFFGDPKLAFALVIFCQIWASMGYEMVIFIAGLQNIADELYEAASIDGASEWKTFWRITLPQLWPTVCVNLLLCIIGSLSSFQIILMTTGGTPPTRTLSMFIYEMAFGLGSGSKHANIGRQGLAAAMQMILFAFILVVTLVSQYIMNKFNREDE